MSSLPDTVTTARLSLPLWTDGEVADIRAGHRREGWHPDYPRQDDLDAAALVVTRTSRERDLTWGPRHIVLDGLVVGSIGFFGPPEDGDPPEVEVGYGLVADARGKGVASEALAALLVETDRVGVRVRAGVLPDNRASIRVLAKSGFIDLRGTDEEGQLVMGRPLPAPAR